MGGGVDLLRLLSSLDVLVIESKSPRCFLLGWMLTRGKRGGGKEGEESRTSENECTKSSQYDPQFSLLKMHAISS